MYVYFLARTNRRLLCRGVAISSAIVFGGGIIFQMRGFVRDGNVGNFRSSRPLPFLGAVRHDGNILRFRDFDINRGRASTMRWRGVTRRAGVLRAGDGCKYGA